MREPQKIDPTVANLVGGPAGGQTLHLKGATTWREYVCVKLSQPGTLAHHYLLVAAGVYEHAGACVEFKHSGLPHVPRCPGCGCPTDMPHGQSQA